VSEDELEATLGRNVEAMSGLDSFQRATLTFVI
jgi:hypothetical protein